jgi:hypothetical protein
MISDRLAQDVPFVEMSAHASLLSPSLTPEIPPFGTAVSDNSFSHVRGNRANVCRTHFVAIPPQSRTAHWTPITRHIRNE